MTKGSGSGKTPERVTELLREKVSQTSQSAVSKDIGLGVAAINRYLNGIGEPTSDTMHRLAEYFETSVGYLLGDPLYTRDGLIDFNLVGGNDEDDSEFIDIVYRLTFEELCKYIKRYPKISHEKLEDHWRASEDKIIETASSEMASIYKMPYQTPNAARRHYFYTKPLINLSMLVSKK